VGARIDANRSKSQNTNPHDNTFFLLNISSTILQARNHYKNTKNLVKLESFIRRLKNKIEMELRSPATYKNRNMRWYKNRNLRGKSFTEASPSRNPSGKRRAWSDNWNPGVLAWVSPRGSGIGRENIQHKRKQGEQTWQPGGKTKNKEPLPAEASTEWKAAWARNSWRHEAWHRIDGPLMRTTRKHERQQMKSNYELDQDKMMSSSTSEKTGKQDSDPRRRRRSDLFAHG
jgi:hypothetical protein